MEMTDRERAQDAVVELATKTSHDDADVLYLEGQFREVRADERAKFESPGAREAREYQEWLRGGQEGDPPFGALPSLFRTPLDHRCTLSDHEEILVAIKDLKEEVLIERMGASALSARIRKAQDEEARTAAVQVEPASPNLRKAKDELTEAIERGAVRAMEEMAHVGFHVDPAAEGADRAGYVQVEPLQKPVPSVTTVSAEEDGATDWQMPPEPPEAPFLEGLAVALEKHAEQLEEEVLSLDSLLARLGTAARLPRKAPLPDRSEVRADSLFVRLGSLRWRIDGALSDLRTLVVIFEKEVG